MQYTAQYSNDGYNVLFCLLPLGGIHKQRVDQCLASQVFPKAVQVNKLKQLIPTINKASEVVVCFQDIVELLSLKSYKWPQYVQIKVFHDHLVFGQGGVQYSPVYSVFNKRAKQILKTKDMSDVWTRVDPIKNIITIKSLSVKANDSIPDVQDVYKQFKEHVEAKYDDTRNNFGSLFDYSAPSSSFMGLYISAGRVSIKQLISLSVNQTYIDELLWNQFCILFIQYYGVDVVNAEYGPYNRKEVKWCSDAKQEQLLQQLYTYQTKEPLINAIMKQLVDTGFVPNRLRMVFASWCFQQRLDWRVASYIFEKYLIDYYQSSNVYNWLFGYNLVLGRKHVFSIERQIKKFDPERKYIHKYASQSLQ